MTTLDRTELPWKTTLSPDAIKLMAIEIVFVPIAALMLAARLYARRVKGKRLKAADYFIIAGWTFSWGVVIPAYIVLAQKAFGWPAGELNPLQLRQLIIVIIAAIPFWALSTSMTKLSVLFFYMDIFESRRFKIAVWIVIAVTIGYCLANFIEPFVTCRPMAKQWDPSLNGVCGDEKAIYVSTACMNVIVDAIIVLMPATQIWHLQMPTLKKIGVILVFAGGFVIVVFTALRIAYIELIPLEDFTAWAVPDCIYAQLEVIVGISVACLPVVQPTFVVFGRKLSAISLRPLKRTETSMPMSGGTHVLLPVAAPFKSHQDKYFRYLESRYGNVLESANSQAVAECVPKGTDDLSSSHTETEDGIVARKDVSVTHEAKETDS